MTRHSTPSIYEALASIILPDGILDLFEVTNVAEEHTGILDERRVEIQIIHIHLDERDLRSLQHSDLQPNGFTESRKINDFPIRDRKVVLHIRRRRWLDPNGKSIILSSSDLTAVGTNYSKEFADVLKKIFGHIPCSGPFAGAILQD